ncbi:2Fe-2S iron-sulfur cluster-binding protein [Dactylococcopsis salina]|uniref:Ferredoxin n=1 Tax=Dactylococcopsis salina (strain PCC 8305) TaxID=13035 RepID=K9YVQ4_DACS8|nr:2Fe-2S iron-sulfur cluster binding domain-containing protein [Dactylococcopsis salina]AFZ50979.1 ferredoxin [Dactylococcopsis salina PCC 8305]
MSVKVHFLPDDIIIEAQPGEPILDVAERAGLFIPTGCMMGSCHACEVELGDGTPICSCISAIPDQESLTINLLDDIVW